MLNLLKSIFLPKDSHNDVLDEKIIDYSIFDQATPKYLGIQPSVSSLTPIVKKLEDCLDPFYMSQIKERVMNHHHFSNSKYEWLLLEMKRFLILSSIIKDVSMYSSEVDIIWHEMLLFTKEYEDFCLKFKGSFIHHRPNTTIIPPSRDAEEKRALFDLIYSLLFQINPQNSVLLKPFFCFNLNDEVMFSFKKYGVNNDYFIRNVGEDFAAIQREIIDLAYNKSNAYSNMTSLSPPESVNGFVPNNIVNNKETSNSNLMDTDPVSTIPLLSVDEHIIPNHDDHKGIDSHCHDSNSGSTDTGTHSNNCSSSCSGGDS